MKTFESISEYKTFMQSHPDVPCPIRKSLDIIGGKWKIFIVLHLFDDNSLRFGELSRNIPGITNAMLTSCLRDLEKDGIINRVQYNEIPPHVEYSLTEEGKTLSGVLLAIANWGMLHEN